MEKNQFEVQELITTLGEISKNHLESNEEKLDAAVPCAAHYEEKA